MPAHELGLGMRLAAISLVVSFFEELSFSPLYIFKLPIKRPRAYVYSYDLCTVVAACGTEASIWLAPQGDVIIAKALTLNL